MQVSQSQIGLGPPKWAIIKIEFNFGSTKFKPYDKFLWIQYWTSFYFIFIGFFTQGKESSQHTKLFFFKLKKLALEIHMGAKL
jgi:hypothetical protein